MVRVILLCGAQASGKSTYGATLGCVVHSRDEVRSRLRAANPETSEEEVWMTFLKEAAATMHAGHSVVLDSTLANPMRRDEAVAFFRSFTDDIEIHRLHTPLAECHRRNDLRPAATKVEPTDIDRTYRQIEEAFMLNPPAYPVVDVSGSAY